MAIFVFVGHELISGTRGVLTGEHHIRYVELRVKGWMRSRTRLKIQAGNGAKVDSTWTGTYGLPLTSLRQPLAMPSLALDVASNDRVRGRGRPNHRQEGGFASSIYVGP